MSVLMKTSGKSGITLAEEKSLLHNKHFFFFFFGI